MIAETFPNMDAYIRAKTVVTSKRQVATMNLNLILRGGLVTIRDGSIKSVITRIKLSHQFLNISSRLPAQVSL